MARRAAITMAGITIARVGVVTARRELIGRALGLRPARHRVRAHAGIRVPLPDGVTLMADRFAPVDDGPLPTILIRTPYGRSSEIGPFGAIYTLGAEMFAERGYHVVVQGVCGDVLTFTTPPLESPLDVIGPVRAELYVRSSLAHTDFIARLCVVDQGRRSSNICDGLFRVAPGKGAPQPDGSLRIEIDMWATAQRFLPGQRVRLQVCSAAHPRWSRNLGNDAPLGHGRAGAVARQTIHHDAEHPSALVLPVRNVEC
ncbi:MAG: CocE/NonD family hydrolase [Chloroflexales bacterium]